MEDRDYMALALELAEQGAGWTCPNPMVGAVLVKDGRIIGQGWHHRCGELHAEREALAACTEDPAGSTLYVTLEPCCHQGRQPPCVDAVLDAGIRRVVVGTADPNPMVSGRGIALLRARGVDVEAGVLEAECRRLNRIFFHYIRTRRPYVVMKYAMTMDGKIATRTGASRWITGPEARAQVHRDRNRYAAILVGVGTVLADDPLLTCRLEGGRNPLRIVCDTHLCTPLDRQLVRTASQVPTLVATCSTDPARIFPLEDAGCQVWTLPEREGHVDLSALMERLGAQGIDSVILEGGGTLNWAALEQGIVHKVQAYLAPKLLGGRDAKSPVEGLGVATPAQGIPLKHTTVTRLGADLLLESEVDVDVYRNR